MEKVSTFSTSHLENIQSQTKRAGIKDYVAIARPDNWPKNIFMVPGMLFAYAFFNTPLNDLLYLKIVIGIIGTCLIASSNYVINEYLDAEFDKYHPLKRRRTSVVKEVSPVIVYAEYAVLAVIGLALAWLISVKFFWCSVLLLFMGLIYNVRPFRSKERVYLDVLSESVNNPIRFALGWFIFAPDISFFDSQTDIAWINTLPPASIILGYWMGGAFLMATKRFAEYRLIGDPDLAGLYRRSFRY